MDKKKAVKLATASAVAASAFVAANPHASQAATDVATVVSQAKAQMKQAYYTYSHTVTETGQFPDINDVYAAYNKAKQAYANAVAVVNKAGGAKKDAYLADLQATYETYVFKANPKSGEARVATYIDAYNYATKLDAMRQELKAAVDAKDLKKAEELYHKISYELKTRTVILDRVYGQTTRELLRSTFKADAQALRDSLIYDITVAMKAREAQDAVKAGNLDKAKAALDQVNQYVSKVTDAFKAELQKAAQDANAAYEAALTPKVESVSAINLNQIKITFNKELDALSASDIANFDVKDKVAGTSVLDTDGLNSDDSKVTLQADKKSVIIDLNTGATPTKLTVGKTYEIVVKNNLKFADGKTLGTTYSETIVADDKVAPTVQEVKATATGFQIKFNEPIDLTNKGVVKVNGVNLPATAITPGSDKFTVNVAYTPEAGKTYSITTVAFEDLNGNQSETATNSVTYSADNTAPVLQSVTAQDEKTIKLVFSEEIASGATATVSRDTTVFANAVALRQDTNEKNVYYVDLNNNLSSLYPAGATSTTVKVDLSTFKDAANNVAPAISRSVTLNKDVTAPTVVSEDWDGTNYVLKFSEKLKASSLTTSGIIVTDETGALVSGVTFEVHADKAGAAPQEDGEYLLVKGLASNKTYTISFPAGVVTDTSIAGNANAAFTKTVTTKAVSNDTDAPTLSSITPSTSNGKNVITLVYNETLDASARDLANFKLDGADLPSGAVAYLTTTTNPNDTIVITLPESAVSYDGQYTFTYMSIKDKNGNTAKSATKVVTLKDTVKPVLTSAKITGSNTIELTFSEPINDATLANLANVVDDFAITVNGVDVDEATAVTGVTTGSTANDSKIVLTLTGYNLTGQTVTVTTTATADTITDNSSLGNTLKTGVTVTATN
ncbi:UNVERIFIED_ORG: hypothetical protein BDK47_1534 [Anoxybacillus amylolyticus]